MKKSYYIVIGILLIIVLIAFFLFSKQTPTPEKIPIQTSQGILPIADIKKIQGTRQLSENDTLTRSTDDYDIIYFDFGANNKSFLISIKSSPIILSRQKAEAAFLQDLNITQEQACLLNVSLGISKNINANFAGQEFGLSFCPNGKPFPNQ